MERYLSFELSDDDAQKSDFAAYTLGDSNLLPHYFGDVAPINIFLGENNSGKSRFMRSIMKCHPTRMMNFTEIVDELGEKIKIARGRMLNPNDSEVYKIEIEIKSKANDDILSFFILESSSHHKSDHYYIDIEQDSIELEKIFNGIEGLASDRRALLNSIREGIVEKYLITMKGIMLNLRRAFNIYDTLRKDDFQGMNRLFINDDRAQLASSEASVEFVTGNTYISSSFRDFSFREELSITALPIIKRIETACSDVFVLLEKVFTQERPRTSNRTYIPTLRTARTLIEARDTSIKSDIFNTTTLVDYELTDAKISVHTGLSLYKAIDEKKNSEIDDREEFERFELFISETFFNGKPVRIVPNRKKINILVAVDREERALPHLGDGIQAIILLLYPLFIAPEGAWFFIEEPETHLHPGFQRLFIQTIATHPVLLEKKLTIFLTTHSNHLLDFAFDEGENINLFTFRKTLTNNTANYQVQVTAPHDLGCLTALGVQNSSVFLSNCTIWVEGITDRIYIKAYLAAYLGHLRKTYSLLEGLHYSFLEYAGANVSHYTFGAKKQEVTITAEALKNIRALSISNRIMLIADQDAGKDKKHQRLTSQQHAGFEYIVTPTREIENLLKPEVIVGALKKLYPKQAEYFDATQLKQAQYKSIYLAKHLKSKFAELPDSFGGSSGSGTVSSAKKRLFAEAAAEEITSWNMLSPEAQELTKRVFQFIMGHNPRLGSN